MDTVSCKKPCVTCNDSVSFCTFVVMEARQQSRHQGAVSDVIFLCDSVNSLPLHITPFWIGGQIQWGSLVGSLITGGKYEHIVHVGILNMFLYISQFIIFEDRFYISRGFIILIFIYFFIRHFLFHSLYFYVQPSIIFDILYIFTSCLFDFLTS